MSFEGSIGEFDLVQRLVELGREHFTGAIRFEQDGIIKIVYFKTGDVLSASTNDRKDAIDEILLRAGKVSKEHVKQALAKRQESETLGDALLNLGFITRKELTWARRVQVIGILRSVRAWTSGTYAIVENYLPKREEGTLFPLQQILVEFIVTEQDRPSFDRAMDGGEAVFQKGDGFDDAFRGLDLNEDAAEIAVHIDGSKSAGDIAAATGKDAFNVYKLLEALRLLGLITKAGGVPVDVTPQFSTEETPEFAPMLSEEPMVPKQPMAAPADDLSFETAGVADAADAWNAPAEPPMTFDGEQPKVPFALQLDAGQIQPPSNDKQWGFDEAQIEASERAAMPHPPMLPKRKPTMSRQPVPKTKRRGGLAFALIFLLILAGIGIGGWMWWQGRKAAPSTPVVSRPVKHPVIQPARSMVPPVVATTDTVATTTVPTVATTSAAVGTSGAARPKIATATPVPVPATAATSTVAAPVKTAPVKAANAPAPAPSAVSRLEQTTTGGKMITNATSGATTDNNRGKYDSMATQFAQNPTGAFTVQFELVCQTSSLAKAMDAGGSSVWFIPTSYRGQSCYRVFWGHFDSRGAAVSALGRIPAGLRGSTPVVVPVPKP